MKCLLLGLMCALSVQAEIVEVANFRAEVFNKVSPSFKINPEKARAWVSVEAFEVGSIGDEMPQSSQTLNYRVDGLSYDAASMNIIYTKKDGSQVVCANVTKIKKESINYELKDCQFLFKSETKEIDDGYYVSKVPYISLALEIN